MNNLNRKKIIALLQDKKVQDYTFNILFFLIFSFFVIFAIRPNLVTAFSLQRELQEIKLQSREYEEQIMQIVTYQSTLETHRNDFTLLDEAVPDSPELAKVIEDVSKSATDSGVVIKTFSIEKVNYIKQSATEDLQQFTITADLESNIINLGQFFDLLTDQRRLKSLESVTISKAESPDEDGGDINLFKVIMTLSSKYL